MRFVRKEHIITTIFNKELTEDDDVKIVFDNLYKYRIDFTMTMKKFMPQQHDYFNMNFDKVRIKKINDNNTVDLLVFKKGVKTTMKNVSFTDIVEINATTMKNKILDIDSDPTRFDFLDL